MLSTGRSEEGGAASLDAFGGFCTVFVGSALQSRCPAALLDIVLQPFWKVWRRNCAHRHRCLYSEQYAEICAENPQNRI